MVMITIMTMMMMMMMMLMKSKFKLRDGEYKVPLAVTLKVYLLKSPIVLSFFVLSSSHALYSSRDYIETNKIPGERSGHKSKGN